MKAQRIVSEHYGIELREGDALMMLLPPVSELERDAEWGAAHGWKWTYFPDGSKTASVGNGAIRFSAEMRAAA